MARWRSWTALLVLALPILVLILVRPSAAGPPAEQGLQRHPASHVIRVTAKLTFDGKPVEIDGLVDCKTTYRGTPTSTPHLTFELSRSLIARETPDGGMIVVPVSRSFCFVYGNTWGDVLPGEFTPPEVWTPVIEWYDHRDPRQAETGIYYLSETALNAENGRLRIVEPFRISIPQHPASEALIAEAAQQARDRDFWMGISPNMREAVHFRFGAMNIMLRITEEEWRKPARAVRSSAVGRYEGKPQPEFGALASYLDSRGWDDPVVAVGYVNAIGSKDIGATLMRLRDGRFPLLVYIYERGIPKTKALRNGLLISHKTADRYGDNPFFPDFFDEYVPFTCIDDVMTPVTETPGLIYWIRNPCSHPDHYRGIDFFGARISGWSVATSLLNDQIVFDRRTGDLWWINKVQ